MSSSTWRATVADATVGARFAGAVAWLVRNPVSPTEARQTMLGRLRRRERDFLALMSRAVFGKPECAYFRLLQRAGCTAGDLARLVQQEGLEGALTALFRAGVYLTVDEFKGRRPIVRGNLRFSLGPNALRNPRTDFHVRVQSGGSRGARGSLSVDLRSVRERSINLCVALEARGGLAWEHGIWEIPGGAAIIHLLRFCGLGARPTGWFSQVALDAPGLHPHYRWSEWALQAGGWLGGVHLPRPVHAPLDQPQSVLDWAGRARRAGRTPHLYTFPSSAVALCQAAGGDLAGAQFTVTGEPLTAARRATVEAAGAGIVGRYGSAESSVLGEGCLEPREPDEMHLLADYSAVIQAEAAGPTASLPATALLETSLRPTSPLILLNVSMGDQAILESKPCGCPLEGFGLRQHLHTVRSFEKLTAGGMTFFDSDIIRVLEEVLPGQFGGGPTDYQLLEQEAPDGRPSLTLLVHPRLGALEPAQIAERFLSALGQGAGVQRVMELQWRQAGLLSVERAAPRVAPSGKVLHLHQASRQATSALA
jgi:hypothetical protein